MAAPSKPRLASNPRRLIAFEAARCAVFFLPVFYLYFEQRLAVDQVIALEAIYYLFGMVFEVPSGVASDRLGRKPTLVLAAALQMIGALLVFTGDSFAVFALGQALLASSWSFVSGTDTALLYESLKATGRAGEQLRYEVALSRAGLGALSAAAFLGGLLGTVQLKLAYLATAALSGLAAWIALGLVEPPRAKFASSDPAPGPAAWFALLGRPIPRFALLASICAMVLHHVPLEFLQPIVRERLKELSPEFAGDTPWVSGALLGSTMLLGALATHLVPVLRAKLSPASVLLGSLALQGVVLTVLAFTVHPVLGTVLVLRSVPQALARPVLRTLLHPELTDRMRATWFSGQSLLGQGVFAAVLFGVAAWIGDLDQLGQGSLQALLGGFALLAGASVFGLAILARQLDRYPSGHQAAQDSEENA